MARCPAITLTATNSSLEEPRRGSGIGLELRRGVTKPYTALSRRYPGIDGPYWSDARKRGSASTFYREVLMSVKAGDLDEIERAGRHCAVCRSGRHWRRFKVVRPSGGQPVVMCAACQARYGDAPPAPEIPKAAP